jgi:UDP-glucose 4-epimerase
LKLQNALVFGSFGFVGFALCQYLLENEFEVYGVDPRYKKAKWMMWKEMEIGRNANFNFIEKPWTEIGGMDIPKSLDAVIYCFPPKMEQGEPVFNENNIFFALQLAEENNAIFIYVSSLEIFSGDNSNVILEELTVSPATRYGTVKHEEEQFIIAESKKNSVDYVILRLPTLFGPWQHEHMTFSQALSGAAKLEMDAFPDDVLHVKDAAKGIYLTVLSKVDDEIIHLGSGKRNQWMKGLEEIVGNYQVLEGKTGKVRYVDIKKAKKLLDFDPEVNLSEGIENQRKHMERIQRLKDNDWKA